MLTSRKQLVPVLLTLAVVATVAFMAGRWTERMGNGTQIHPTQQKNPIMTFENGDKLAQDTQDRLVHIPSTTTTTTTTTASAEAPNCPKNRSRMRSMVYNLLRKVNFQCDAQIFLGLEESGVAVDVGALDGADAVAFATAGKGHRVYTFEGNPKKEATIRATIKKAGSDVEARVKVVMAATSNSTGKAYFYVPRWEGDKQDQMYGGATDSFGDQGFWAPDQEKVEVKKVMLDDIIQEHVLFMKIDTQGHELPTLQGAKKLFTHYGVDYLRLEFWPKGMESNGYTAMQLLNQLSEWGYACFDCHDGDPPVTPWRASDFPNFIAEFNKKPRVGQVKGQKGSTGHFTDLFCIHVLDNLQ